MPLRDPQPWAIDRIRQALAEIPRLSEGPDEVTPEFEDWVSNVARALNGALGPVHHLIFDFEQLTRVHVAYSVQRGVPGSSEKYEQRNSPHVVLRRSRGLLEDALSEVGSSPAVGAIAAAAGPVAVATSPAMPADAPTAFVSYTWESEAHRSWVREFAARLRRDGVRVTLDQWEVAPGDQLPEFMERAVRDNQYVLVVCTPRYKVKSDSRTGGAGYEGDIMTAELFADRPSRKFIPVLRLGDEPTAVPSWLRGRYYIDLTKTFGDQAFETGYQDLVTTLHGERETAPAVQPRVRPPSARPAVETPAPRHQSVSPEASHGDGSTPVDASELRDEPVRILGVIADQVSAPRNDGSRGSALYSVPFRLNRTPSSWWATRFVEVWDRPPQFTTMHRPGIASVVGDTIRLDGTTLDEVQRVHRDTLKIVLEVVNREAADEEVAARRREAARAEAERERLAEVERLARAIKFD